MFSTTLIAIGPVGPIGMTAVAERWYTTGARPAPEPHSDLRCSRSFPDGRLHHVSSRVSGWSIGARLGLMRSRVASQRSNASSVTRVRRFDLDGFERGLRGSRLQECFRPRQSASPARGPTQRAAATAAESGAFSALRRGWL